MFVDGELCQVDPRFAAQMQSALQSAESRLVAVNMSPQTENTMVSEITDGGVALLKLDGPLVRWESSLAASYPVLQRDLQRLEAAENVRGVVLVSDCPGGSAMLCGETCAAISAFSKPIVAFAAGYMTSAAYRLACHCDAIYATESANVGNIGTRMSVFDRSQQFRQAGVEVVMADTGPVKSLGFPGLPVTDEQRAFLQTWVNRVHDGFTQSLAERGLDADQIAAVSSGEWWLAADAVGLGLVDQIKTLDEVVAAMASAAVVHSAGAESAQLKGGKMTEESQTAAADAEQQVATEVPEVQEAAATTEAVESTDTPQPQAATLEQLRAVCAGASSDFLVSQLDAKATTDQALQAYNAQLREQLQAAQESQEVERVAGEPVAGGAQFEATGSSGKSGGADPVAAFEKLVAEESQECGDRFVAFQNCVAEHPEAYSRYREAVATLGAGGVARRRRRQVGRALVQTGAAE